MEDIIKRIVDMDRQARKITEAAKREKMDSEDEIARQVAELRENYLQQARRRIQVNSEMDRTIMEQTWQKRKAHYDEQATALEEAYAAHHDEWVAGLVTRALEG